MTVHDCWSTCRGPGEQNRILAVAAFSDDEAGAARARHEFLRCRISRATEIEKLFEIPPDRIEVVYNAIDERFLHGHASRRRPRTDCAALPGDVSVPALCGTHQPAQERVRMIEAFSALKTELEKDQAYPDLKLIIIGDDLSGNPDLRRTVVRSGVQNDVRFLGFIPIEVLRIFYDEAKIFVFPSLYEGSGCLRWKPWRTERRWSPRMCRPCRRWWGTRRCW